MPLASALYADWGDVSRHAGDHTLTISWAPLPNVAVHFPSLYMT